MIDDWILLLDDLVDSGDEITRHHRLWEPASTDISVIIVTFARYDCYNPHRGLL